MRKTIFILTFSALFLDLACTPSPNADEPQPPSDVQSLGDERSAIRFENETYEDAVIRHEKTLLRNHPDLTLEQVRGRGTAQNAQVPVSSANFSGVPVWNDSDIKAHFEYSRDLRFQTMSGASNFQRRLSWLYPDDGCFARAELVKAKAVEKNLQAPYKLFSFGNLRVKTSSHPNGYVSWWYHVVPVVKSAADGQCYVLDAAIDPSKPLPWKDWLLKQVGSLSSVNVAVCDPNAYTPDSQAFGDYNPTSTALSDQKNTYLKSEWSRQTQVGRDPNVVLGNNPPWGTTPSSPLAITSHPDDLTVTVGQKASLSVAASGGTQPYTYQWFKNGTQIGTASTCSFTAQSADNNAQIHAVIKDAKGTSATSNNALLTVIPMSEPLSISEIQDQTVAETKQARFEVQAQGGKTPYTYQWYQNSKPIAKATAASYSLITTFADNGSSLHVVVRDAGGDTMTSNDAMLAVTQLPSGNVALNKRCSASSTYGNLNPASAVDESEATYWASAAISMGGPSQWLSVDLGESLGITSMKVKFSAKNYPRSWALQYESNGVWKTIYSTDEGQPGWNEASFGSVNGQKFRILATANNSYYYTIYDFQLLM